MQKIGNLIFHIIRKYNAKTNLKEKSLRYNDDFFLLFSKCNKCNLVQRERECKKTNKYENHFHINDLNAAQNVSKTTKIITLSLSVRNINNFKENTLF